MSDAVLAGGLGDAPAPAEKSGAADLRSHPMLALTGKRLLQGMVTLVLVSILVFAATQLLPGNAASAALGNNATPQRVHQVEAELNLDRPFYSQYWSWASGLVTGDAGTSLANRRAVTDLVGSPLRNSAVILVAAALISSLLGIALGVWAASRKDSWIDHVLSIGALGTTALPEFVVGIGLLLVFSTLLFHLLPAVSTIEPGASPFSDLSSLVLPIATLILITLPYTFRMTRSAMIEALSGDYVEMATLKGLPRRRILFRHALTNALPPIIQVVGLNLLYLAGGIVVVEYVFNYPGIGQVLVSAVTNRDIPLIQFVVLLLAAFYIVVNIATDVVSLAVTPRRRLRGAR